jgi:hypothetical protein
MMKTAVLPVLVAALFLNAAAHLNPQSLFGTLTGIVSDQSGPSFPAPP